jgi:5-formyltetrahydrofolate cyclo-ligase
MSEIVSEAKQALRLKILANRSKDLSRRTENQFTEALFQIASQQNLERIGCYLSFGSEPVTDSFIELARGEGIEIACPRVEPDGQMVMALLKEATSLSRMGFREPTGETVQAQDLDLVVVPALAIDYRGQRLGRGAGYFDKYLERFFGPTVGLVYDAEFLPEVPSLPHDAPVSLVITQTRTIDIPFER